MCNEFSVLSLWKKKICIWVREYGKWIFFSRRVLSGAGAKRGGLFLQNFFVLFGSLKTTDVFRPSMKCSLHYHQQNFIYAFFKKMTVKHLFE